MCDDVVDIVYYFIVYTLFEMNNMISLMFWSLTKYCFGFGIYE